MAALYQKRFLLKFWIFRHYWWFFTLTGLLLFGGLYLYNGAVDSNLILPLIGTYLSLIYFIQKQKLEETKLFREIFAECNKRYDQLNDNLNEIVLSKDNVALTIEQKNKLDDYFNLCGEEYLYFKQGYIYPDVWESWKNGMRSIVAHPKIREHWVSESATGSYYGLEFDGV